MTKKQPGFNTVPAGTGRWVGVSVRLTAKTEKMCPGNDLVYVFHTASPSGLVTHTISAYPVQGQGALCIKMYFYAILCILFQKSIGRLLSARRRERYSLFRFNFSTKHLVCSADRRFC